MASNPAHERLKADTFSIHMWPTVIRALEFGLLLSAVLFDMRRDLRWPCDPVAGLKAQRYSVFSRLIGNRRILFPVALKIALAIAGAIGGVLASPIPPGLAVLGTRWTSTSGISSMRSGSY